MRNRSRNDEEKAQRYQSLLDAAQNVFFRKGFEQTSMDEIATEAGFSRALLYVYFEDKKDIYSALRIRSVEVMRAKMLEYVNPNDCGINRVKQIGEAFYDFYRNDRSHFDCLSLDISLNNQQSAQYQASKTSALLEAEKKTMDITINALHTGFEDGSIDPKKVPNVLQTAMFLRGSLHGVIMLQNEGASALLNQASLDKEALVRYTIDNVTNALKP